MIQTLDHHWKEHLATLDALRQVIHLRSYAQKKPIDEYKQEAFLLFERLLVAIREEVTRMLMRAQVQLEPPPPPVLPDFITQHLDPFSGDDDTADIDASTGAILSNLPPLQSPQPPLPQREGEGGVVGRRQPQCAVPVRIGQEVQALPRAARVAAPAAGADRPHRAEPRLPPRRRRGGRGAHRASALEPDALGEATAWRAAWSRACARTSRRASTLSCTPTTSEATRASR